MKIVEQIRTNLVAIISLVVAVSSLSYNTWRNELTEDNRNQRSAAFEILLQLEEIQQLVFHLHYDKDDIDKGNPRAGWARVLTVRDFSLLLNPTMQSSAQELVLSWEQNWEQLGEEKESLNKVLAHVDATRDDTLTLLRSLR